MAARRRLAEAEPQPRRGTGRAWINGLEAGGVDDRLAYLTVTHD